MTPPTKTVLQTITRHRYIGTEIKNFGSLGTFQPGEIVEFSETQAWDLRDHPDFEPVQPEEKQ